MPGVLTFEAAATVPTVFITADTAFRHAVSLTPEQPVLIHAAAGECTWGNPTVLQCAGKYISTCSVFLRLGLCLVCTAFC